MEPLLESLLFFNGSRGVSSYAQVDVNIAGGLTDRTNTRVETHSACQGPNVQKPPEIRPLSPPNA